MSSKLYQRMIIGISAFIIVATGVFAPLSFGIAGKAFQAPTETSSFALMQPLRASAQGALDTTNSNLQALETQEFNSICRSSGWVLADPEAIACNVVLWVTKGAFKISGILAAATGGLFDYMLWFTIQSSTYAQSEFIETGWGILRDLANIIFIIALIIAALNIMLSGVVSLGSRDGKKMLASVIVAALLVNFSLFFAQVIVDASHILARTFYNRIDAGVSEDVTGNFGDDEKPQTAISVALLTQINPQKLVLDAEILTASSFGWTTIIALYTFMTIIHGVLIFIFLSMALMFIGRTVALMFGMIISPFSFATLGTPMENLPYVGFYTWMKDLAKNAFMVPVFLFFLYLTVLFMGGALAAIETSLGQSLGKTLGQKMIDILIPMSLIIGLLMGGKSAAGKMASEIASQANSLVGKGVGLLAGSALTVGAGALTMGAGAVAGGAGKLAGGALRRGASISEKYKNASGIRGRLARIGGATTTKIGSQLGSVSERVKNANVDVRSSFLGQKAMGALGAAGIGSMTFGAGKYTSAQDAADTRAKEALARSERDAMFRNQAEEAKKKEQAEIIVNSQAENDEIMSSDAYLSQQKAQEDAINIVKDDIKAEKEELKSLKEAYAQTVATYGQGSQEVKNALGEVKDKQSTIKDLEERESKMSNDLASGAFYKGADDQEQRDFEDKEAEIKNSQNAVNDYRKREREISLLQGLGGPQNRTQAQNQRLMQLTQDRLADRQNGITEDSLRGDVATKKQEMQSLAETNSAAKLKINREKISNAEKEEQKIEKQMNLNNRRAIKQELDLMNNTFNKMASTLLAGLPGAVVGGLAAGISGAPMGALAGAGILGGVGYAGVNTLNKAAHGFNEQDRKQLRDLFRKTTKKEDK